MATASGRKTRAHTLAARGRGQNAATEDEEGKGVNIEKVASEKQHATIDGSNGGNDENGDGWGEFKGLGKKLAESKWRLSTAQFKQFFSADMLNSRPFMRQIVAWAEYGEYTLEQALEAARETRHRMDECQTNRRSRIPRKHQWTAQHLTKALERLHAQGEEQTVPIRTGGQGKQAHTEPPAHLRSATPLPSLPDPPIVHLKRARSPDSSPFIYHKKRRQASLPSK